MCQGKLWSSVKFKYESRTNVMVSTRWQKTSIRNTFWRGWTLFFKRWCTQLTSVYLPNACWYLYCVSSDNDAMHFQCIIYIAYHCTNSFSLIAFHWLNRTLPHLFLHEDKQIFLICIQYSEIHCKLIWGKSKSYFVLLSSLTYFQNQRFHVYLGLEGF